MTLTIRKAAGKSVSGNILLCRGEHVPQGASLRPDEVAFVKKQLAMPDKTHAVLIRPEGLVIVLRAEKKHNDAQQLESVRRSAAHIHSILQDQRVSEAVITGDADAPSMLAFAEGLALANYQFIRFKKDQRELHALKTISLASANVTARDVEELSVLVRAVYIARDLVNEPANILTATRLAEEFRKMGKEAGFSVEVLTKARIKALKMGGLLAVNLGSQEPPTFTIMEYKPAKAINKRPVVLVGKGVVYDTGGLSLKPTTSSMDMMKCDMAGAATVGAAIYAAAKAKLPVHLIALVPATDNRPGENAYAPGDVITMYSGHTVEMLNADAEGRMILADALWYAKKYNPELVLDFATLTGAAVAAIGNSGIVSMGTAGGETRQKLQDSGMATHERLAEMPFWDDYDDLIKSDIADMKNIGGPVAGAITAGKFLARYTDYPWMHFDIAGPAFLTGKDGYRPKGATGVGVRLLFHFLKNY